jgi:hypothetical protein
MGGVLHGANDFRLHPVFIFSRVPGNHDLEGYILLFLDVTGQPGSGEATMAEFVLYAVCPNEQIPDMYRIG